MIFRRKIGVPEARGSKRLRLVKVALLAFLMTPKVAGVPLPTAMCSKPSAVP